MSDTHGSMSVETLRSVPMFASLDDAAAAQLQALIEPRDAAAGSRLFRRGDSGDAMFLIESGRVRISLHDEKGVEMTLTELGPGDFFGEMALIDGKRRSADATVIQASRLAVLPRKEFLEFVRGNGEAALAMLSAVNERLRATDLLLGSRASRNVNEEERAHLTAAGRAAHWMASLAGSWWFVGSLIALIACWIVLNGWILASPIDRAPFQMLSVVLAVLAAMQAPIILMSQNLQDAKDRLRADLDYQVNLKNELALAEVLRRLDALEAERGVPARDGERG